MSVKPWMVTVPLLRWGKPVPQKERLEQLERFKAMTGSYVMYFDTEEEAEDVIFPWSQALGFSVAVIRATNPPSTASCAIARGSRDDE
jgi:hypothetical protein